MVKKLLPELNKVYFINSYSLFHILRGQGSIEVDFRNYADWDDKAIYLSKGQYIKFLSDDFEVRVIEFPDEILFRNKDVRVLFKHLISLGYINFSECRECRDYLNNTVFSEQVAGLVDVSSQQWYWQNPFEASKDEYHVIFDVKDIIDEQYAAHLTNRDLERLLQERGIHSHVLVRDKIGVSIKGLLGAKRLVESKREIAFSDLSIQEVAYRMGFKDPSYFNRSFKQSTGQSPMEFRKVMDVEQRDSFTQDILELIKAHHKEHRKLGFYADRMNLSVKALSRKTSDRINTSLGQLIRSEVLQSARKMLAEGYPVQEVAYRLCFEEAQHFSSFFKKHTGQSPSEFKLQKYQT